MTLTTPEALLLAIPAGLAWWHWGRGSAWAGLRLAILALAVLAAAGPRWELPSRGSDVILVLDRSRSVPPDARADHDRQVRLVADQRRDGDRLAVVVVGREAATLQAPDAHAVPRLADAGLDEDGTDLAGALALADGLVAPGRSGRVVLISDGEATGRDPRPLAAPLARRGLPLHVLPVARPLLPDAGILQVEVPGSLRLGESFVGAASLRSDQAERRRWEIRRGTAVVASGEADLTPGRPVAVRFADRPPEPGLVRYTVTLDPTDDARPLDNTAQAAIHVTGGEQVLVMAANGTVANALRAAGMEVVQRAPGSLRLDDLLGVKALVLDQVPADRLGMSGLQAVATWVRDLGGGLVVGGGPGGLGAGGYFRSPLDPLLPVGLEVPDEVRRLRTALALVLDRSGSMAMPAGGGRTKMDLADEGACAAIELLGPQDEVTVIAVDSAPHIVVPLSPARPNDQLLAATRAIESRGGGIFVHEGLVAGLEALSQSQAGSRHLVLFADANDSEEPGAYQDLLAGATQAGMTVSVIAMGTPQDADARLLEDIARLGKGRITFATEAADIPRLFAQETLLVARTTWQRTPSTLRPLGTLPGVLGLESRFAGTWPTVSGYNVTLPRPRAQVLALAPGDPEAPALAAWNVGTGHAAVVGFDLGDPAATAWPGYVPLVAGLVRWSAGTGSPVPGTVSHRRFGDRLVVTYEQDPARPGTTPDQIPTLRLIGQQTTDEPGLPLLPVGEGRWEAEVTLGTAAVVPAVEIVRGDQRQVAIGPAAQVPMSPEAEARPHPDDGRRLLTDLARRSGGQVAPDLLGVFDNPPSRGQVTDLAGLLLGLALVLAVVEIALRRWRISRPAVPRWSFRRRATPTATPEPGPAPTEGGLRDALRQVQRRR